MSFAGFRPDGIPGHHFGGFALHGRKGSQALRQGEAQLHRFPLAGPAQSPSRIEPADRLEGAPLFPGLVFDLEEIGAG
ncbi:MAG: hypothetical protein NTW51_01125 [Cyanobacteria bacterium]|nr:hypothetical protein [Cyanobacteriota bacterium]